MKKSTGKELFLFGSNPLEFTLSQQQAIAVDVNKQNMQAVAVYAQFGFEVVGRTETDSHGRDHPVLQMKHSSVL